MAYEKKYYCSKCNERIKWAEEQWARVTPYAYTSPFACAADQATHEPR